MRRASSDWSLISAMTSTLFQIESRPPNGGIAVVLLLMNSQLNLILGAFTRRSVSHQFVRRVTFLRPCSVPNTPDIDGRGVIS